MSHGNTALRITELDFDQIKTNLKEYLSGQSEFVDYDFEGSGMSILLDALAYNTHYMGFYTNMVANEMFGDTAQLRNSVLSHAKHVNYETGSMKSAKALVDIIATPNPATEDANANVAVLSRYTKFLSNSKDGTNYQFVTLQSNTALKDNGSFSWANVWINQGEVVTKQYLMNTGTNPRREFKIPSANCDTDTIQVTVQASISNTDKTVYTKADDITLIASNSTVYWVEEESMDTSGHYKIYFGDGVIGQTPPNNSVVLISYLDTNGEWGNKLGTFVATDPVGGYSANVQITTVAKSAAGADKESIEEIRFRAPLHYTSQNRAVTVDDFKLLILRDYPNIDSVAVWSGAENDPPVYGKVFISLKPRENYQISTAEKDRIKNEIIAKRSIMTVIPEIVDPDYTYLLIRAKVWYNPKKTTLTADQIGQLVKQAILDYKETDLETFDSVFRESKLHRIIDRTEKSITSSEFTVFLQKRFELTLGETKTYDIDYKMPLKKANFPDQAYSYPSFIIRDAQGVERKVFYEVTPDSFTGVDSIEIVDPGTGYTETPVVTITGDGLGATATATIVNGRLESITVTNRGSNYSRATVSITGGGSGSGASATAVLGGQVGVLRTFYYNTNGEKIIVNDDAGEIRFDTGAIIFSEVLPIAVTENDRYANNYITFNIQPEEETIFSIRNRILDIDQNISESVIVEVEAEDV